MCGVIGLVCEKQRSDLGVIAGELLVALQYRGYDSAGAAVQGDDPAQVTLLKGVGAPSELVPELGIDKLEGRVFCGQVRWATFGVVDKKNAQPHVVRCKNFLYGAHNGNVTNCDQLKAWLIDEGHAVQSDNDGEMVVHCVEHFFAEELERGVKRGLALRAAVVRASARLEGSFAAVIVDPITQQLVAIKRGSSLYFGLGAGLGAEERPPAERRGSDPDGLFAIASSDLSSVLQRTRLLVPLSEGEMIVYSATEFSVYSIEDGAALDRAPLRSHLRVEDAVLHPPFQTFMEQEIHAQPQTVREALRMFAGGSPAAQAAREVGRTFDESSHMELTTALTALRSGHADDELRSSLASIARLPLAAALTAPEPELNSSERGFFADLLDIAPDHRDLIHRLDAYLEAGEATVLARGVQQSIERMQNTLTRGGRIFLVCCGTSFHAAKAASLFFAELAGADVLPLLPGEFRGQYALTLRDHDLFVAVSQSGETKDLIDVLNLVIESGLDIGRIAVVNNLNSTLAHEKSHAVVPLQCGPEIAVPATKSFLNQLTVFYGLARRLGEANGRERTPWPDLPALVAETITRTEEAVERAAELTYLAPSIHLLAIRLLAVAREGALKIREVVLNHTEGFEGSEFKHGPNTILGFNTLFGPAQVQALLDHIAMSVGQVSDPRAFVRDALGHSMEALYADYPLVFITGPLARDVELTISQVHTHKIRGSLPIMVAEEDKRLRRAIERPPGDGREYHSVYISLPSTGDTMQTVFSASVALQLLALRMSEKKLAYLDGLGLKDHGVHPDVPKNVSKSITVD